MRKLASIAATTVVTVGLLTWARRRFGVSSVRFAFVVVWIPMVAVGTLSRVAQLRLPDRYHRLRPFEADGRVYERLGVRAAKSALRRGPLAVFNPDLHLPRERTTDQLARLDQRMRDAEASHVALFTVLLGVAAHAAARRRWSAAVSTLIFDVLMNLYPVMLQRYNRARLAHRFGTTTR